MNADLWVLLVANLIIISLSIYFAIFVYPHRPWTEETIKRPRSFVSNAYFREFWYFIMDPLKKKLIEWDVQPNSITVIGFVFSLIAGFAFAFGKFGFGGWLVILSATCDVYDGQLARAKKLMPKSGAYFDSVLDRVGEAFIFGGLLWFFRNEPLWFLIIVTASAASQIVSYARARAEGLGFGGSRGFFQRAERMIVLSIGMPLSPFFHLLTGHGDWLVKTSILFISVGSIQTALSRSVGIYREIRATEKT